MKLLDYQRRAAENFNEHKELTAEQSRMLNWCIGLSGEVGEVMELVKHHIWAEEPLDKMSLAKEIGDVLWYVSALCTTNEIALDDAALLNIEKLNHRYGGTSTYSNDLRRERHYSEAKFKDTPIYKDLEERILSGISPERRMHHDTIQRRD